MSKAEELAVRFCKGCVSNNNCGFVCDHVLTEMWLDCRKSPHEINEIIKSAREIELMRHAGHIAMLAHEAIKNAIKPGITTKELDKIAYDIITKLNICPWHSWIARQTPTLKVEGSNPFG